MPSSIVYLLPFLVIFNAMAHEFHHKAFRPWKTPKLQKNRLSLIIQKLRMNENTKFSGAGTCPVFQSFSPCACEPTCNNPNPLCNTCEPGCTCRNGFVRSPLRLCVLPEECPNTKLRRFELAPPKRLYEAVPVVISTTTTSTAEPTTAVHFEEIEVVTAPLLILQNGPTPPSAPPMFATPNSDMIGAPAATPPPDFSYGPPGMSAANLALYEDFLKEKRIMKALRLRRNRFAKKML
uniref:TIL domain-containing protein n=1 Tax=Caenorhabditis japonica TaxID=281687 RepID=A0A8R1DM17_CAEJA